MVSVDTILGSRFIMATLFTFSQHYDTFPCDSFCLHVIRTVFNSVRIVFSDSLLLAFFASFLFDDLLLWS